MSNCFSQNNNRPRHKAVAAHLGESSGELQRHDTHRSHHHVSHETAALVEAGESVRIIPHQPFFNPYDFTHLCTFNFSYNIYTFTVNKFNLGGRTLEAFRTIGEN